MARKTVHLIGGRPRTNPTHKGVCQVIITHDQRDALQYLARTMNLSVAEVLNQALVDYMKNAVHTKGLAS